MEVFYEEPDFLDSLIHFWKCDPKIAGLVACAKSQCYANTPPHRVPPEPVTPASSVSFQHANHLPASLHPAPLPALQSIKLGFVSLQPSCPVLVSLLSACSDLALPEPQDLSMDKPQRVSVSWQITTNILSVPAPGVQAAISSVPEAVSVSGGPG